MRSKCSLLPQAGWLGWSDCCHCRLWLFRFINPQRWVHMAAPHMLAAKGYVLQEVLQGKESTWKAQPRGCRCRPVMAKGTRYHGRGEEQQHCCTPSTETLLLPYVQLQSSSTLSLPQHSETGKRPLTALYDSLQMSSCRPRLSSLLLSLVLCSLPFLWCSAPLSLGAPHSHGADTLFVPWCNSL